eukprot:10086934-Ditylum_brightwellii.AAC.1
MPATMGTVLSIHPSLILHFLLPVAVKKCISASLSSAYFWWVGDEEGYDDGFAVVVGRNNGFVDGDDDGCSKTDGDHDSQPMICIAEAS